MNAVRRRAQEGLRVPTLAPHNNSGSVGGTGVRNVPGAASNRSVRNNRNLRRPHKQRENGQAAAVVGAVVAIVETKPRRIRPRRRPSTSNRVLPARRVPLRKAQLLAPRATARKSADVFAAEEAVAAGEHRRAGRRQLEAEPMFVRR
jgi:hypothetical protein